MDKIFGVSSNQGKIALCPAEVPVLMNGHQTLLIPLQTQVAGHSSANGKSSLGMLLHPDGYVLKPAEKKTQGENEIKFYQHLNSASDPISLELKEYVPKFYGTRSIKIHNKDILFIVLQNVTDGMREPCVMDVKIGKQTWEPNASEEKKKIEKAKYVESKRECGFCIPGMQFYSITDCQLIKNGKEYGKKLDKSGIKDALKLFLNWDSSISRPLILQFLCKLWKILRWFRCQRQFRFYSSSLLFVYDAHLLRHYSSVVPMYSKLSGEAVANGSTKQKGLVPIGEMFCEKIKRYHSPVNNFEQELDALKEGYFRTLDGLKKTISCEEDGCPKKLADVKMIDFAHTLISSGSDVDSNYLEGLQNLVGMFEILLGETY